MPREGEAAGGRPRGRGAHTPHSLTWQGNGNDQNGEARNAFLETFRTPATGGGPPEALRPEASLCNSL